MEDTSYIVLRYRKGYLEPLTSFEGLFDHINPMTLTAATEKAYRLAIENVKAEYVVCHVRSIYQAQITPPVDRNFATRDRS